MSEPQNKPVDELMKPATPTTAAQVSQEEQVPITLPSSDSNDSLTEQTTAATAPPSSNNNNNNTTTELSGDVKTLKDAFPDLDIDVIETILASQGGNLDAAFEVLLGMSDPSYKPEPEQSEGMNQLRQDEEYARRLAREGDAHYPQNNTQQQAEQPLFNFQEELPIIKEKVIEAGTAAKNKIMSLYNQFMAPDQTQQQQGQSSQGGVLESGMGNLSLSDNQAPPRQQYTAPAPQQQARPSQPTATSGSVDLYEWDGKNPSQSPVRNPLLSQRKESFTSTPAEQMLSDEEFARQLAREDAETSAHAATPNTITTPPPAPTAATANTTAAANVPITTATTTSTQHAKSSASSDNEEVTFSALDNESEKAAKPGYTHTTNDDDDLDDLFDKQDSNLDLSVESIDSVDKEAAKTSGQK
ncbi:hypothetical protein MBANPS3_010572 [Mucor bainieri]